MKKLLCLILCCFSLVACNEQSIDSEDTSLNKSSIQNENVSETLLPEWIGNFFEKGTYSEKIRLANNNNNSLVQIYDNIQIPESRLLSILFNTPMKSYYLYEDTKQNIITVVDRLKELKLDVLSGKEYEEVVKTERANKLFETELFLCDSESNYIRISVISDKNALHLIQVYQGEERIYAMGKSFDLLETLYAATGTQKFDKSMVKEIQDIHVFSNNNWNESSVEYKNIVLKALAESVPISNFSAGCPFDLRLQATMKNGDRYQIKFSTDDCGVMVIEDKSFEVTEEFRELVRQAK